MTSEFTPKRLELLKELAPRVSRVTFLHDPEAAPNAFRLSQEAAPSLGIRMHAAHLTGPEELIPELTSITKERLDALLGIP
jgi:putative ABC transport system substrate-binding protein